MAATKTEQFKKILDDAELREHAMSALQSVQHAVEEARATEHKISKKATNKLKKQEKKLKKKADKQEAAEPAVAEVVADPPAPKAEKTKAKKKKRHPVRKLLFVATLGAVVAMVVSEDARKAVLDALFGAEEEFQYTSQPASGAGTSSNGAS